ncbi:Asp-tRNA(Asn)/Glu-tRNA(Gln) amidotransferase subunit GatB, partial [bacterium]|nr:Asp-tRNA(Asn)/Glu-tRNA(Gln) amidotransferase subunit GatB [bacterium]
MNYETVIGLEVHVQLSTKTKIFCGCSTNFGASPNTQTCPVCLGLPGVLPVLNKEVVQCAIKTALATNCKVVEKCIFHRKNYFYPDLPKGYQISQYDIPVGENGWIQIEIDEKAKKIRITRVHMEEDAGKLIHSENSRSRVDLNRAGVPLLEIVSDPDINSPAEAYQYLVSLKQILEYLEISDCNMEEGSLRCDANISLRPVGETKLGTKTELKNMNSFKGVQKALEYEIVRQKNLLGKGEKIIQETLLWNANLNRTESMRSKEDAHDYRYFPEPDLVNIIIDEEWMSKTRRSLPELPQARRGRLKNEYGLSDYDVEVLTIDKNVADYFEECSKYFPNCKMIANWITGDVLAVLKDKKININNLNVSPEQLGGLLDLIENGTVSGKIAKDVFLDMVCTGQDAKQIVSGKGLVQLSDEGELVSIIDKIIKQNPKPVSDFRAGKQKALGFLVGQIMRETKGKANPQLVNKMLREKLS